MHQFSCTGFQTGRREILNAFIRLLYSLLIAISVALFIGLGILSFYSPPASPKYPQGTFSVNDTESKQYQQQVAKYDADTKSYKPREKAYQRNVTTIVLPLALIVLLAGLYLMLKPGVIGEGLALGGILTAAYGVITASIANSNPLRFLCVTLLLLGALLTAQLRFSGKKPQFGKQHAQFLGRLLNK